MSSYSSQNRDRHAEGFVWGIVVAVLLLFSFAPSLYELLRKADLHNNREFELVHNFPTDYNFYLSRIREGLEGRWTVVERYTAEPHDGSFIHAFYLLLGRVGAWVRVPVWRAGDVYHIARLVLSGTLLVIIVALCRQAFGKKTFPWQIAAFLAAVTASSWPKLTAVVGGSIVPATLENIAAWRFGGYMAWWSVMDSLQRMSFIPHLVAGQAMMGVLIMAVTRKAWLKKTSLLLLTGILAFGLGMIFPPGLLFIYAVMGWYFVLAGEDRKSLLVPYGAIVLMSVPSLLYLALMTSIYPWKRLAEVDIIRPLPFDYLEYVRALGPVFPLGIMGLIAALLMWQTALLPLIAWVLAWGTLLLVFNYIPQQSPLRFSEMIPHVPLGILTVFLFSIPKGIGKKLSVIILVLLIGTGLFHMYSSLLWQKDFVDHKIRATLPLVPTGSYVMYPLKDFVSAIRYLAEVTGGKGVILSETTAGNYIPVISGNTVYLGHDNTVAFEGKKEKVKEFFSGRMTDVTAREWLRMTSASYVFYGPQEREDNAGKSLSYPFLSEVYKNSMVTVYRVEYDTP
ncbi:MAG: hypothetical protein ACOY3M_01425 [Patescibacteria group bacterium]